jgi:hypothetical protein
VAGCGDERPAAAAPDPAVGLSGATSNGGRLPRPATRCSNPNGIVILQPKVARPELPWVTDSDMNSTATRLWQISRVAGTGMAATALRLEIICGRWTRVARLSRRSAAKADASRPWALGQITLPQSYLWETIFPSGSDIIPPRVAESGPAIFPSAASMLMVALVVAVIPATSLLNRPTNIEPLLAVRVFGQLPRISMSLHVSVQLFCK